MREILKFGRKGKNALNKITIADNVETQDTPTIAGQKMITIGPTSNVHSKAAVGQTFVNLIDSAQVAWKNPKRVRVGFKQRR
jgi:hypothetical protein